jgi:1-acyl-sn-glycerol-3-phosphate acyltransferase
MESALMTVFTPWQVEFLGAADIPHERSSQLMISVYGAIPVHRGSVDRAAMRQALDVLAQGGVLAAFPEGGIWEAGAMRPQTGVAWLSYRTGTPVLPIGFGGTLGALGAALRLERPRLSMNVGRVIPAATIPDGISRKAALQDYAGQVLAAIRALVPPGEAPTEYQVSDERFELLVTLQQVHGKPATIPPDLEIVHGSALAKLLHRPAILKLFRENLRLPVEPLEDLQNTQDAANIARATQAILNYLQQENPYLLTYRFGPKEAEAMQAGLQELQALAWWGAGENHSAIIIPVRHYRIAETGGEITETDQGSFRDWR